MTQTNRTIPEANRGMPPAIMPVAIRVVSILSRDINSSAEFLQAALAAPMLTYHLWSAALNGATQTPPAPSVGQLLRYLHEAECFVLEGTLAAYHSAFDRTGTDLAPGTPAGDQLRRALAHWMRNEIGFIEWAGIAHLLQQRFDPRSFDDLYGPFRLAVVGTDPETN